MCTPQCMFEKLGGLAFDEAIKAGKYVVNYAKNLQNLKDEMDDLHVHWEVIERKVCEAHDRGEEIEAEVENWQMKVNKLKEDVERLMGENTARKNMRCIKCSCPNIRWRYKLSKQAEENIVKANKLTNTHFEEISHPRPRPPELEFLSDNNYVNFDSRASIFKYLMDALKDSNVNMIGVYGLGGVGKTTLVKEVSDQMRQDGTFKQVAIAAVSKDLNVKEIQSKLADSLNLELKVTTDGQERRRTELWNKFKNGDKYLVILDDIWEMVDLKKIGIPISDGKTGCKVVLTSRKEDLLRSTMKADINFRVGELPEAEAWDLFKKKVGNSIESQLEIYSLARELCRKCNGLPLAINALGAALQDKPEHTWKTALDKVKRYMLTQVEGIDPGVMATLRVSYDMLRSSDAQSCFLLCCLFADAEIPTDELTRHCMARCLLAQNPRTFDEAKNAVFTVVDSLKSASLLTTGSHENVVKIHDVIRDVGISIARNEKAFLIDHGVTQWPQYPTNGPSYSAISLNIKNIKELPEGLVYPQLYTLMVDSSQLSDLEVPDNFFNGMTQLRVLSFTKMRMRRLPSSLAKLKNLRMLNLNGCELADIAILKDMKYLEVLSLRGSRIDALPPEIAQLTSLRLLDLRFCHQLMLIPRGIISNLTKLEELHFPDEFDQWEVTTDKKKESTSSSNNMGLEELRRSLTNGQLTTLHIFIPNVMLFPKEGLKFENLTRFRISVGSSFGYFEDFPGTNVFKHEGSSLRNEFIPLVDKAEALSVIGVAGLKKVFHDRGVGNGFPNLKYLKVESCEDDLEYFLGEPKSSVQSHRLHPSQSFNKLTILIIEECKLRYLFSPTAARGLVHLEQLTVRSCEIMEAIVGFEGQNEENELIGDVIFSKLKKLFLQYLPNLMSFYAGKEKTQTTAASSSSAHAQPLFSYKVILPVLEELEVQALDSIEEIWDKQSPSLNEKTVSFSQLKVMTVCRCKKLMNLVPSNILPWLRNLQDLTVDSCPNVEFVIFKNGKEEEEEAADDSTVIIPQLRQLKISYMKKLKSFYSSTTTSNVQALFNHQVILPVLEELEVEALDSIEEIWDKQSPSWNEKTVSFSQLRVMEVKTCMKLMNLVPSNLLPRLRNLQDLIVKNCPNVEFVVFKNGKEEEEEAADDSTVIIPQLRKLEICNMMKLKSFYSRTTTSNVQTLFNHQVILPVLEELEVEALDSIEEIWDKQSPSWKEKTVSFSQLRVMEVKTCMKLMNLVPSNLLPRLRNLQDLIVKNCPNVEFVVFKNGKEEEEEAADDSTVIIPQLRKLEIRNMKKLKSFYSRTTTSNVHALFNHQVIFPVLERLTIQGLDNIIEIWDKQSIAAFEAKKSFCQLNYVVVQQCHKLMHVYPYKMHPLLKNIKYLQVENCETMEGVVGFEGEVDEDGLTNDQAVCFSKLTRLYLCSLPKLVSFCTEMGEAGTTTEGNPTIHAQPLFNGKVAFPALEDLTIWGVTMIANIWAQQPLLKPEKEVESFCKLKSIEVLGCPQLEVIVSNKLKEKEATNNDILVFPQLNKLTLQRLDKLECFYAGTDQLLFSHKVAFPALKQLKIEKLPKITELWNKQLLPQEDKQLESFGKLCEVVVDDCDQLVYVFPSYMLPQLQANLRELKIANCKEMELVFSEEVLEIESTNNDIIVFRQLWDVNFGGLPKLNSFYAGTPLFFSNKVAFPALKQLEIKKLPKITELWNKQLLPQEDKQAESFGKLREVVVDDCDQLVYVFPSYMLPQLQTNLQILRIRNCKEMELVFSEEVLEIESTNNDIIVFRQLRKVELQGLPKLKSFYPGTPLFFSNKVAFPALEYLTIGFMHHIREIWDKKPLQEPEQEIESFSKLATIYIQNCDQLVYVLPSYMLPRLQNLQKLLIVDCNEVEVIVSKELKEKEATDNDPIVFPQLKEVEFRNLPKLESFYTGLQVLFSNKVAFPALEYLTIGFMHHIREIWDKKPLQEPEQEIESFSKLATIYIQNCDQLVYVLPSYMLPRLQNLQKLLIVACNEVEVIVSKELKEKEATDNDPIVFPQLKEAEFRNLPKLESFYTGTQILFSNKVAFPALEYLTIGFMHHIREIWDKKPLQEPEQEIESFSKLATIYIPNCDQLVYVLPSYMLPRLQNLKKLQIVDCNEVEVIVSKELKEKEATDNDPIVFPQLKEVKFRNLPKLESFYTGTQILLSNKVALPGLESLTIKELPKINEIWDKQPLPEPKKEAKSSCKLRLIDVQDCNQLVYVFPSYMLPQLQNLQKLVIANCMEMEVIISNKLKEREATNNDIILFAKLKTVILQILPNLIRLCAETQLGFSNKDAFQLLEANTIRKEAVGGDTYIRPWWTTSSIDPDLTFLVDGTSRKEESGTSSKDEDNNDGEEDVKNADDNEGGGEEEEKDVDEYEAEGGGGD